MYEHKTLHTEAPPTADQLNELSRDGWELFMFMSDGYGVFITYFRRPLTQ